MDRNRGTENHRWIEILMEKAERDYRARKRAHERVAPRAVVDWLVKFINARSDELSDLCSPRSNFREFVYIGKNYLMPPSAEVEGFHSEFVQVVRGVIEGKGQSYGLMKLPSHTVEWQL